MCGGRLYLFEPGEKRTLDGFVAYHALNQVRTGLEEYREEEEEEKVDYRQLSWKQLRQEARGKGYRVGMSREAVIALLENGREKA
jgi:hypothetical protein